MSASKSTTVKKLPGSGNHATWSTPVWRAHLYASIPKFKEAQEENDMDGFWVEFYKDWFSVHDPGCLPENVAERKAVSSF